MACGRIRIVSVRKKTEVFEDRLRAQLIRLLINWIFIRGSMVDSGYSAVDNLIEAESAIRCSDPGMRSKVER